MNVGGTVALVFASCLATGCFFQEDIRDSGNDGGFGTGNLDAPTPPVGCSGSAWIGIEFAYPNVSAFSACLSLESGPRAVYVRSGSTCSFQQTDAVGVIPGDSRLLTMASTADAFATVGTAMFAVVWTDRVDRCPAGRPCRYGDLTTPACAFRITHAGRDGSIVEADLIPPCELPRTLGGDDAGSAGSGVMRIVQMQIHGRLSVVTVDPSNPDAMPPACR